GVGEYKTGMTFVLIKNHKQNNKLKKFKLFCIGCFVYRIDWWRAYFQFFQICFQNPTPRNPQRHAVFPDFRDFHYRVKASYRTLNTYHTPYR
ncbi:hypothetical protein ET293_22145, partial [Salmonella enterica]|nr:hypothetical protein [Salmonella enterica]